MAATSRGRQVAQVGIGLVALVGLFRVATLDMAPVTDPATAPPESAPPAASGPAPGTGVAVAPEVALPAAPEPATEVAVPVETPTAPEPAPATEAALPAGGGAVPDATVAAGQVAEPGRAREAEAPGIAVEPPATVAPPPVDPGAPAVDVVRVSPDGAALVAGLARPGSDVTIYAEDQPVGTATADADGNFVAMFETEPSGSPTALTVGAREEGKPEAVSGQVVVILPTGTATPEVAATAIVTPDDVEVMPVARPRAGSGVSLTSISYSETDEITLAGFGLAGAEVRAYVNDAFARGATVGADGKWKLGLAGVAGGVSSLRIEQVSATGKVTSKVETPFKRDFPKRRPGQPVTVGAVVVQPGHTLWTLARERYGSGVFYTQIFQANEDVIGDPNLIYPGQIFRMPDKAAD